MLNKNIDEFKIEKVELSKYIFKLHESYKSLSFENDLLNERFSKIPKSAENGQGECIRI